MREADILSRVECVIPLNQNALTPFFFGTL